MKKNLPSNAGIFSPRMLLAFSLCFAGIFLATFGVASGGSKNKAEVRASTAKISPAAARFGGLAPTVPNNPRYQNFYAPAGSSAQPGSGEFNIGFNPFTHRIM